MAYFFFGTILLFLGLFYSSKGKYDQYLEVIDSKMYPLKSILPIGFWILEKSSYGYTTLYDQKLRILTAQIQGSKYAEFYLRVHWANKVTALFVGFVLAALIGAGWGKWDPIFPVFVVLLLGILFFAFDQELIKKIEKRKFLIRLDFPDFINKLILLINAGMTVTAAFGRIVEEATQQGPIYQEASICIQDIKNGTAEVVAYESFARKCRVSEVTKFISILTQNLRKGNDQMIFALREMSREAWEMRKHVAKRLGEEASTKLLLPMLFNFLIVVIIVAMPAFMAMRL